MDSNFIIKLDRLKGLIYIEVEGGEIAAEMNVSFYDSGRIIIEHTLVKPKFNGKGYGKLMVEKAVVYARQNGLRLTPICEYAKNVIDKNEEYKDILY